MTLDEMLDVVRDGQGANAAVGGRDSLVLKLVAGFDEREVRSAVRDQADLVAGFALDDGWRQGLPGRLVLARDPVQVLLPVLGSLAIP